MELLTTVCLVLVALIHLAPVVGVIGPRRLEALYGHAPASPEALLLMRHRAVLFGIVGGGLLVAALDPGLHGAGLVVGAVAAGSFLVLARGAPDLPAPLRRVVRADWLCMAALALGTLGLVLR